MTDLSRPDKKRIAAVFGRRIPDRVPNFEVLVANPTLRRVMGRDVPYKTTLDNIPPEDYVEFATKVGQDVIGMSFYDSPLRREGPDGALKRLDFRIGSRADLDRVRWADLSHLDGLFALLDRYAKAVEGTDVGLFVLLGAFFTDVYTTVFGFEQFMYVLHDEPALVEEVLERYADYYAEMARRLVSYPLTFFYVGDDLAYKSGTLVPPDTLRRMWVPRMARVFAPARERGIPILFHSDGNIEPLLRDIVEMGANGLNPVEPYGMDIRDIKRRFGSDLALVGNLDVGGALSQGTTEDVRREARALIDDVGKGGGLVLASCHSITSNVKPENYLAMAETAWTHGAY